MVLIERTLVIFVINLHISKQNTLTNSHKRVNIVNSLEKQYEMKNKFSIITIDAKC